MRSADGYLGGVCAGLGERFDLDPTLLRLAWLAAVLLFGSGVFLYAVLWWVLPRADQVLIEPVVWRTGSDGRHHPPLIRTVHDRRVLGVCGAIARRWNLDPSLVRLGVLSLITLTGGTALIAYGIGALFIPGPGRACRHEAYPIDI